MFFKVNLDEQLGPVVQSIVILTKSLVKVLLVS